MNLQICAGGSSLRALEATLHLCAAGLGPPKLAILVIDPDKAGGNYARVKLLIENYVACQVAFGGKLGTGCNLFGTELDLLDSEETAGGVKKGERGLKIWTPVQPTDSLRKLVKFDGLKGGLQQDTVRLLFTEKELDETLGEGFRGHPAIGAAALSLLTEYADTPPWSEVIGRLKNALNSTDGARICITGSVFGGTGASAIHPVARFLRPFAHTAPDRLKIGVVALVPYFKFIPDPAGGADQEAERSRLAAKSEWFAMATRSAVEYYDHLRKNEDWPFDAVFWAGDSDPIDVPWSPGGSRQKNPAHFVDVLAALASLEFMQMPKGQLSEPLGCAWSGPRQDKQPPALDKNLLDWADLPFLNMTKTQVQNSLLRLQLVAAVHLGFGEPLVAYGKGQVDSRIYSVPWYKRRFSSHSLRSASDSASLDKLAQFFRFQHLPWLRQILSPDSLGRVRLFDPNALTPSTAAGAQINLGYLADLLWADRAGVPKIDVMDRFFTDMCRVPVDRGGTEGAPNYLSLLAHAADSFVRREYSDSVSSEA